MVNKFAELLQREKPQGAAPARDYQQSSEFTVKPEDVEEFKKWDNYGPKEFPGLVKRGNVDLTKRPIVHHSDGSVSSLYSGSIEDENGNEILIPGVTQDGKMILDGKEKSEREIARKYQEHYQKTGEFLAIFKKGDWQDADKYAEFLHKKQGAFQTWKHGGKYTPSVETYDDWQDKH